MRWLGRLLASFAGLIGLHLTVVGSAWLMVSYGLVGALVVAAGMVGLWRLMRVRPAPAPEGVSLDEAIRVAGWDAWAAGHRLRVLDVAPDPGHAGADLTLVEVVEGRWAGVRLVQVIDASPNAAGVHERHAIAVPRSCRTARDAIAATWGLPAAVYRPERHT